MIPLAAGTPITSYFQGGKLVLGIVVQVTTFAITWRAADLTRPLDASGIPFLGPDYPEALSQEGVDWIRGWEGPEVDAFKAACAL